VARLTLRDPLPLHVGDRVLLRDPGSAAVMILGATVLDAAPPALARRGAAASAGRELAAWPDPPSAADLLRRHGFLRAGTLAAMGVPCGIAPVAGDWLADPDRWASLRGRLAEVVAAHARRDPLAIGMPPEAARAALGLPDRALAEALARDADGQLQAEDGYLRPAGPATAGPAGPSLPPRVAAAVRAVLADLAAAPFLAPDAARLRELGLDHKAVAAAARAGLLLRVAEQVVLAPGADRRAAGVLAGLPQPFTTAEARQALGTTRRVAIPLLEYLDRAGVTQRLPDDRRRLRLSPGRAPGPSGRRSRERRAAGTRVLTSRRGRRLLPAGPPAPEPDQRPGLAGADPEQPPPGDEREDHYQQDQQAHGLQPGGGPVIPDRVGHLAGPAQEAVEVGGGRRRAETPAGRGYVRDLFQPEPQRQDAAGQHDLHDRDQHQRLHGLLRRIDERGHG